MPDVEKGEVLFDLLEEEVCNIVKMVLHNNRCFRLYCAVQT